MKSKKEICYTFLLLMTFFSQINAQEEDIKKNRYIAGNFTRFIQEFISLTTQNSSDNSLFIMEYGWQTGEKKSLGIKIDPEISFRNLDGDEKTTTIRLSTSFFSYTTKEISKRLDLSYGLFYPIGVSYSKSDNPRNTFTRLRYNVGVGCQLRPTFKITEKISAWTELGYSLSFILQQDETQTKAGSSSQSSEPINSQTLASGFFSPITIFIAYNF